MRAPTGAVHDRLIRVPLAAILDQFRVQHVLGRDPGPILWTTSLPVDQVLYPPPASTLANQTPDCKGRTTLDEPWRGRGRAGWDKWTHIGWPDLGDVLGRMNPDGPQKFKPYCRQADYPCMGNGPMNLGVSFLDYTRRGRSGWRATPSEPPGKKGKGPDGDCPTRRSDPRNSRVAQACVDVRRQQRR